MDVELLQKCTNIGVDAYICIKMNRDCFLLSVIDGAARSNFPFNFKARYLFYLFRAWKQFVTF